MLKVSQLITLPIINIYNLKIEGHVENVVFNHNKKTLELLKIYDESLETYKAIKFQDIYSITNTAIFIKNASKITLYENAEYLFNNLSNPINTPAFLLNSNKLGAISDISINQKGLIENIIINNAEYSANKIVGFSNDLLLLSDTPINLKKFKPIPLKIKQVITQQNTQPVVSILNSTITPKREITDQTFLLNRKVLKDIKTPNGEIIVRQNSTVTMSTINKVKYYGKLKELAFNSK